MRYLSLAAILGLSLGSVSTAHASEVHTDLYVSAALGNEILPSISNSDFNKQVHDLLAPSSNFYPPDFGPEIIPFGDSSQTASSSLIASDARPGLFSWFSASELSFAGGGSLLLKPNSRNLNLSETKIEKSVSTSYIFYPADIQAQSASLLLLVNNKVIISSINHISYGTFKGYDENAIQTDNYTSSDTWIRLGYSESFKNLPLRFGMSNQVYFSKLENYKSTFLYSSFGLVWEIKKYKLEIGTMINDFLLIHNDNNERNINKLANFKIGFCKDLIHLPLKISIDKILLGFDMIV